MIILSLLLLSCNKSISKLEIDVQGHRGCRGLMPENTLDGFIKAIELGVTTLELDVVVSKDKQVVVSHEAFFNHEITTLPNGKYLTEENEKSYNIYQMNYNEVKMIDVGLKPHQRFPQQQKIKANKPLLSEVISTCDSITNKKINYNIEIKRNKEYDGKYNPPVEEFVDLVCEQIIINKIGNRTTIQSFDHESIVITHKKYPQIKTVLLIQDTISIKNHLEEIGFNPYAYSPYFKLVNQELVNYCHDNNIKIIPWTVNDEQSVVELINLKVDGIISDFPDMVSKVLKEKNKK